jgi:hypothetical protein
MILIFQLLLCPVAALALSETLTALPGPFSLFEKLRETKVMKKFKILECFLCTAVWCAALFQALIFTNWREWLILTFYSAGLVWIARKIINKEFENGRFGK